MTSRCADGSCWRPVRPEDHSIDVTRAEWDEMNRTSRPYDQRVWWLKVTRAAMKKLSDDIEQEMFFATVEEHQHIFNFGLT